MVVYSELLLSLQVPEHVWLHPLVDSMSEASGSRLSPISRPAMSTPHGNLLEYKSDGIGM